ncbi:hypothetical protein H072_1641 [Dactylellina haptotyla CBS 200.50]|uniref:F-box domain-containing protein n=1 Tax=Dactylellina haptotyla (strain CBS 200.50) TaxID=1284197 RepID=S8BY24_DACHA|nr:hypothetical protein H072_1641 [Dactylellina haptotyla CBS 200.50]
MGTPEGRPARQAVLRSEHSQPSLSFLSSCLLFTIPLDILTVVFRYLSLRDIVSLSLTSKLLRDICPTFPPSRREEALCSHLIRRRLLPSNPTNHPNPQLSDQSTAYKCIYCSHPLCPPTCASALYLDAATGIFFPARLYPAKTAKYLYACVPDEWDQFTDFSTGGAPIYFAYATIWCAHHRCPRDLLTQPRKHAGKGANAFLATYDSNPRWDPRWLSKRNEIHSPYQIWYSSPEQLAGYATRPVRKSLLSRFRRGSKTITEKTGKGSPADTGTPVFERYVYGTICMHCLLPTSPNEAHRGTALIGTVCVRACTCSTISKHQKFTTRSIAGGSGCPNCGVATVKFAFFEPFECPLKLNVQDKRYLLTIATLSKAVYSFSSGYGRLSPAAELAGVKRIQPFHPSEAQEAFTMIRGMELIPPDLPRLGIEDLPVHVLGRIIFNVIYLGQSKMGPEECGWVSYSFLRAWYDGYGRYLDRAKLEPSDI